MEKKSKLLFITQKLDEQDDDLAFVAQWVDAFIEEGFEVKVICLEKGVFDDRFPVYSLGKENGFGKLHCVFRFLKLVTILRYESVFVHMNPEYFTLGGWWWFLTKKPAYLWYTHYTTHFHLKLAAFYCKNMFAATVQSLPQYDGSSKKVVTGHGIDVRYWHRQNNCFDEKKMVMVHRLSRSKRVEIGIEALTYLPSDYTLTIYGRPIDALYYEELKLLVKKHNLENRVTFAGPLPMPELQEIYPQYRIMINMASETIDKTMLEAMCNGVYPVTTSANLYAIGLDGVLEDDTPKSVAKFILKHDFLSQEKLVDVVKNKHSLAELVKKMGNYIPYR